MKKHNRLKRNEDFDKIIREGKKVINDTYVLYYMPSLSSCKEHRIGISVSKKLGNAVLRNKIKRQVRMMVTDMDFKHYDHVLIVRNKFLSNKFESNKNLLDRLIRRIDEK